MIKKKEIFLRIITALVLGFVFFTGYFYAPIWFLSLFAVCVGSAILLCEWPAFKAPFLTPIYPVTPFILLIALNHSDTRILLPLIVVAVSSFDMGAYCVGKLWGVHKLAPIISPGKTWEGFVGGLIASIVASMLFFCLIGIRVSYTGLLAVCLLCSITGTGGDLFESYLKRRVNLKDSGTCLPGHGGWLDRVDALLGTIVVVYPLRYWIINMLGI